MKNKFSKFSLFLTILLSIVASCNSQADSKKPVKPKRISAQIVDLGKVHTIYMVPGMATLIELPSPVSGIRLGNPDQVKYFRPENPDNEVTLVLKEGSSKPTNLIILAGKKKFTFDIVPSSSVHQDTIEVVGSYGGAELQNEKAELIDSSETGEKK